MDEVSPSKPKDSTDDRFSAICGDLGLGEGLKPGGLFCETPDDSQANVYNPPPLSSEKMKPKVLKSDSCQCQHSDSKSAFTSTDCCNNTALNGECDPVPPKQTSTSVLKHIVHRKMSKSRSADSQPPVGKVEETFPTFADVPYGTSLRQQRKLFEQNLDVLKKRHEHSVALELCDAKRKDDNLEPFTSEEVQKKLLEAVQEVEELKLELDACRRKLDAKYKAIAILRRKVECTTKMQVTQERANAEISQELIKEVNKLQFELEWKESSFLDSQQTWAERFDRMCQETALLMNTLEARSEELRQVSAQKMALMRERDELLALLDVKERERYTSCCTQASEEDYGTYSSIELAVLGACRCRGLDAQPCGCAHAAANIRREVLKLREEIEMHKQRREEAFMTVDAYRKAFEEQLARSKTLSVRLAELAAPPSSKTVRAKAAIKWLISVLNDDELPPLEEPKLPGSNGPSTRCEGASGVGQMLSPQELVVLLTEMRKAGILQVHEKKEALAHQKLAAQILVTRVQELEKQVAAGTEEVTVS